jgi:hypothetical protein
MAGWVVRRRGKAAMESAPDLWGGGKPMSIDWDVLKFWLVVIALVAFNLPIAVAAWKFRNATGLGEIVQEKTPEGRDTGALSYSRVTGLIGAVVVASLFWIMSNVAIATAILNPSDLPDILNGITKLFFVGAALFLPYAFNQLKSLVQ